MKFFEWIAEKHFRYIWTLKTAWQTEHLHRCSKRRYLQEKIKRIWCIPARIFQADKSPSQAFSWHETGRHYSACLRLVSFPDRHQRFQPNGRHIWSHYKERILDNGNLIFPYGNNSYQATLIDKWTAIYRHRQESYLMNQNGWNRQSWRGSLHPYDNWCREWLRLENWSHPWWF